MTAPLPPRRRNCPVCGSEAGTGLPFLDRRLDERRFNEYSYSSRKRPEFMCYRMLRCTGCDVVYACEAPEPSQLHEAYRSSAYDSKHEASLAARTYERTLLPYLAALPDRSGALDIGTGTGSFLQCLRRHGFSGITGVEPSRAAIESADPEIKPCLREGLFSVADFEPASLSLITCFMTLEHVEDPAALVRGCFGLLKPGGVMAVVVHDWRAWNNRVLGRYAPIVDIEHLQLFSKGSVRELYRRGGFGASDCMGLWNSYPVAYWAKLLPIPSRVRRGVNLALDNTPIGTLLLPLKVGNLMAVARKG